MIAENSRLVTKIYARIKTTKENSYNVCIVEKYSLICSVVKVKKLLKKR